MSKFRSLRSLSLAVVAGLCGLAGVAQADPVAIPLQEIDLDWTTFAGSVATAVAGVIAVSIGVGVGIWMVRLVYRMFRSFARG